MKKQIYFLVAVYVVLIGSVHFYYQQEIAELRQEKEKYREWYEEEREGRYSLEEDYLEISNFLKEQYGKSTYSIMVDTTNSNRTQDIYIPLSLEEVVDLKEGKSVTKRISVELGDLEIVNEESFPPSVVWIASYEGKELSLKTNSITTKANSIAEIPVEMQLKEEYREEFNKQSIKMLLKYEVKQ